tara:strand:- start:3018 stop:5204 length:2187 start_codon:yes stop_codon:yes gene_type:complete
MKKIVFRLIISLILVFLTLAIYLSTIGIKTKRFNNLIVSKISEFDPNLILNINQINFKLNLLSLAIDLKTLGTDLTYKNKNIKLESIRSQISLQSLINNQFALSEIMISTKSIPIKNLISLIRVIKKDPRLLLAEHITENGYIIADLKLEFDEVGKIKKNFIINGLVNNAKLSLLKKEISKLNFIFQITDQELNFKNIKLLLNNKEIDIPAINAKKEKKEFLFSGSINNKNTSLKKNEIKNFISNKFLNDYFNSILFNSESDFTFKIDNKFQLKNLNVKSVLNVEKLEIDNFLENRSFFPEIRKTIKFEKQKIKVTYNQNKIDIDGSGDIFFQKNSDLINYKISNKNGNYLFNVNLKIKDNPFILELIDFEKNLKSNLDLRFVGFLEKNTLMFKKINLLENNNNLSVNNLILSNDYKIEDIENIKFNFIDRKNQINELEIKKVNKNYKIVGNSFNADKLITKLLNSQKENKKKYFAKNFKIKVDLKKVNLDENNMIKNLRGEISFNDNKITDLSLNSRFSDNQKITFTLRENNGEKITTLFSNQAKPLVDRYKFIKGFSEGKLDFYSVKRNNVSKSTLKIYNFKLKELPALTKILTLASLQGIADLLSGEGIRFTEFEMNFINEKNLMTIEEIYAIGPAISVLMEGYIEKDNLISLRGTLVPATTINKTIGSIPFIGNILVGNKVGEGVFGVSFKIKGPPKDLNTSVNPIKTLTPRFITRTLEKIKKN